MSDMTVDVDSGTGKMAVTRIDESLHLPLPPGEYIAEIRLRDGGASAFGLGLPDAEPDELNVLTSAIVLDVLAERARQLDKWGDQRHHDGTGGARYRDLADIKRSITEAQARNGDPTWLAVLEEEVYETFAEDDLERLDAELVQTAAVLVAWLVDVRRRRSH